MDQLGPTNPPPPKARLSEEGFPVPVSVELKRQDDEVEIELVTHGELFAEEKYRAEVNGISLVEAANERFTPPIPLLRFPFHVGKVEDWSHWNGTMSGEHDPQPAKATTTTAEDKVLIGQLPIDAVRCDVQILIEGHGSAPPADRRLTFWFAPGHGLLKRQFASSLREPLPDDSKEVDGKH